MNAKKLIIIVLVTTFFWGCSDDESCSTQVSQAALDAVDKAQLTIDNKIIDDYLAANSITNAQDVNGIRVVINKEGSGLMPCLENTVTVYYKGTFLSNGNVFDSRQLTPIDFRLGDLIVGWQLTFPTFTKGTKATIYIPSGYGYGPAGNPAGVPGNANLIFEIELAGVR